jgi:hypothetical protein
MYCTSTISTAIIVYCYGRNSTTNMDTSCNDVKCKGTAVQLHKPKNPTTNIEKT